MTSQAGGSPSITMPLDCTQCGGELHPDEGQIFVTCPFCGTTVYLDRSRVVFHWYVAPTINEQQAVGALYRWMSGSQTVKDLDKKSQVTAVHFQYFPLWYFRYKQGSSETVALQPAAATTVTELAHLRLPAGDLRKYDPALDAQALPPTVPLEAGLDWLRARAQNSRSLPSKYPGEIGPTSSGSPAGVSVINADISEMALVHVPVYLCRYAYQNESYSALVEASSGQVMANLFPAKSEAPYRVVGCVTALVYLVLAVVLAGAILSGAANYVGIGAGICIGLGGLAAPVLFAWAFWVASKI